MSLTSEKLTVQKVLDLAQKLTPADQRWLIEQLSRLIDESDDEPLPESVTLDEAVELYLADKCSLGRAAELAGVTRWDIQNTLYERGTPVEIYCGKSVEEMDELAEELEREGLLC
jgi:predicted HTH domain antitoxin